MISYHKHTLPNGLRVIIHEDESTPMVAVNVLYNVGARDESPDKTGFAHLFEHLMFGGSANIPDFDEPIQKAGGENNAFTNNDVTNFYDVLPAENLETALWLESDRMLSLNFSEQVLEVQRKVVLEEFNETCINQPYGDVWHHLADLAYKVHPYRWPTIGKVPKHVEDATIEDVRDFFYKFYRPNNAILVVAGNVKNDEAVCQVEKWFGEIPAGETQDRRLPQEPPQTKLQQRINEANVPVDALYMAFHTSSRMDESYYTTDLISDILGNGPSSRLYRGLLKEQRLVNSIDCYLTGSMDPGLLIVEGRPADGVSLEQLEEIIWTELDQLRNESLSPRELEKVKNKLESTHEFSESNILNKAMNLAFYELLGDIELVNEEINHYRRITAEGIQQTARKILTRENCSTLYYRAKQQEV
ncbi:MAG: insulinase family protein [Bacteroidetes bacterium]|nr:insulinase family protein [Bacteroidota bacterium]